LVDVEETVALCDSANAPEKEDTEEDEECIRDGPVVNGAEARPNVEVEERDLTTRVGRLRR
jgi:hypothetical protein